MSGQCQCHRKRAGTRHRPGPRADFRTAEILTSCMKLLLMHMNNWLPSRRLHRGALSVGCSRRLRVVCRRVPAVQGVPNRPAHLHGGSGDPTVFGEMEHTACRSGS